MIKLCSSILLIWTALSIQSGNQAQAAADKAGSLANNFDCEPGNEENIIAPDFNSFVTKAGMDPNTEKKCQAQATNASTAYSGISPNSAIAGNKTSPTKVANNSKVNSGFNAIGELLNGTCLTSPGTQIPQIVSKIGAVAGVFLNSASGVSAGMSIIAGIIKMTQSSKVNTLTPVLERQTQRTIQCSLRRLGRDDCILRKMATPGWCQECEKLKETLPNLNPVTINQMKEIKDVLTITNWDNGQSKNPEKTNLTEDNSLATLFFPKVNATGPDNSPFAKLKDIQEALNDIQKATAINQDEDLNKSLFDPLKQAVDNLVTKANGIEKQGQRNKANTKEFLTLANQLITGDGKETASLEVRLNEIFEEFTVGYQKQLSALEKQDPDNKNGQRSSLLPLLVAYRCGQIAKESSIPSFELNSESNVDAQATVDAEINTASGTTFPKEIIQVANYFYPDNKAALKDPNRIQSSDPKTNTLVFNKFCMSLLVLPTIDPGVQKQCAGATLPDTQPLPPPPQSISFADVIRDNPKIDKERVCAYSDYEDTLKKVPTVVNKPSSVTPTSKASNGGKSPQDPKSTVPPAASAP